MTIERPSQNIITIFFSSLDNFMVLLSFIKGLHEHINFALVFLIKENLQMLFVLKEIGCNIDIAKR